jgi:hypothetical protein
MYLTSAEQRLVPLVMTTIGLCATAAICAAQAPINPPKIVRQVDHILIASSEAKELFSLLSDTFQLPVAWPMSDFGSFASGGVAMGNVNLEIIKETEPAASGAISRWAGFALEPEPLRTSLAELDARGIRHGVPAPFRARTPDGSFTTRWTTVGEVDLSSDTTQVFLCAYRRQSHRSASHCPSWPTWNTADRTVPATD